MTDYNIIYLDLDLYINTIYLDTDFISFHRRRLRYYNCSGFKLSSYLVIFYRITKSVNSKFGVKLKLLGFHAK